MESIQTTFPLELVCMDYLSLEPDNCDIRNILVITDHFNKIAMVIPTKDQKAKTIAKAFWENFIKLVDDRTPNSYNVPVKSSDQLNPHAVEFAPRTAPVSRSESDQPKLTRESSEICTGVHQSFLSQNHLRLKMTLIM